MDREVERPQGELLGRIIGAHHDRLTGRLVAALVDQVPEYRELDREQLIRESLIQVDSVRRYFLGEPAQALNAGPWEYGAARAMQNVTLDVLMHVYRVAWAELWGAVTEFALADHSATESDLLRASGEFFWMADEFASTAARAWEETSSRNLLERERERAATVEALLAGRVPTGHRLEEAARTLNFPIDGRFVAVVGQAADGGMALPGIQAQLAGRGLTSAWRVSTAGEGGVVHVPHETSLETLLSTLDRQRARVGVSPVVTGLDSVASARPYAVLAQRSLGDQVGVRQFSANPVAAVLAGAPDAANDLVAQVLGPVLALAEEDATMLLETLRVWFDVGGATSEAAARLFCHPNTVRYRTRRIEQLTGQLLQDPAGAALLWVALLAHEEIPPTGTPR